MSPAINNWKTVNIGDLGQVITGGTPSSRYPELFGFEYPFITPSDIDNSCRYIETERFLSEQGRDDQSSRLLPPGAVCVVCIGATIGKICMTNKHSFTNQQINSIIVNKTNYDNSFVFYLVRTKNEVIKSIAGGAATPIVNKTAFSNIEVVVPYLSTQKKIAAILSAYDDLIENNNQRIRILEEMARLIYKEWFANFHFPSHEKVRITDSQLGKIPMGWSITTLGDIATVKGRIGWRGYQKSDLRDSGPLVIGAGQISEDNRLNLAKPVYISQQKYEESPEIMIHRNDIIITTTGVIGRVAIINYEIGATTLNPNSVVLKNLEVDRYFLFNHLVSDYAQHFMKSRNTAVAQPAINQTELKKMLVCLPPKELLGKYSEIVHPLYQVTAVLTMKNRNLNNTRNLLIPKLISGEIDVSELDISIVGEAA